MTDEIKKMLEPQMYYTQDGEMYLDPEQDRQRVVRGFLKLMEQRDAALGLTKNYLGRLDEEGRNAELLKAMVADD